MKIIIIESPYAGNIRKNVAYARMAMADSLARGEAPYASHLLYTQVGVLDDSDPVQRTRGMEAGWEFMKHAELVAIYRDLGISGGMRAGAERADLLGIPIEFRQIPNYARRLLFYMEPGGPVRSVDPETEQPKPGHNRVDDRPTVNIAGVSAKDIGKTIRQHTRVLDGVGSSTTSGDEVADAFNADRVDRALAAIVAAGPQDITFGEADALEDALAELPTARYQPLPPTYEESYSPLARLWHKITGNSGPKIECDGEAEFVMQENLRTAREFRETQWPGPISTEARREARGKANLIDYSDGELEAMAQARRGLEL